MPFVITCLLAPICLCMTVYRLISIPIRLRSGELQFKTTPSVKAAALAAMAYVALLGYTIWLGHSVVSALPFRVDDMAAIVRLVVFFEALPIIFVLAEWRFFYGFRRGSTDDSRPHAAAQHLTLSDSMAPVPRA